MHTSYLIKGSRSIGRLFALGAKINNLSLIMLITLMKHIKRICHRQDQILVNGKNMLKL